MPSTLFALDIGTSISVYSGSEDNRYVDQTCDVSSSRAHSKADAASIIRVDPGKSNFRTARVLSAGITAKILVQYNILPYQKWTATPDESRLQLIYVLLACPDQ